jgi:hypothetical protein
MGVSECGCECKGKCKGEGECKGKGECKGEHECRGRGDCEGKCRYEYEGECGMKMVEGMMVVMVEMVV